MDITNIPTHLNGTLQNQYGLHNSVRLFWLTYWTFLLGTGIVMIWDWLYHLTVVFDTPFSPPHVLGYIITIETAGLLVYLTCAPHLRQWFGPTFRPFRLPFSIPLSLFILGSGLIIMASGAILDIFWHAQFGLDETNWSTPHNMLAWGLAFIFLGFLAARLALGNWQPVKKRSLFLLCFVFLLFSTTPLLGPLIRNASPAEVLQIAQNPILLQQAPAQHTFRIYVQWNLTHTNPVFTPLMALWVGFVMQLMRNITHKRWLGFLILAIWSLLLSPPTALWAALLLFFPLTKTRLPVFWIHLICGFVFGLIGASVWQNKPLALVLALISAPLMFLGSKFGNFCSRQLYHPNQRAIQWFALAGLLAPFATGILDLYLRSVTP